MKLEAPFPLHYYFGAGLGDIKLMPCYVAYGPQAGCGDEAWLLRLRADAPENEHLTFACVDKEEAERAIAVMRPPAEDAEPAYVSEVLALADYVTRLAIPIIGRGFQIRELTREALRDAKPIPLLLRGELDEAVKNDRVLWADTVPF
jgi:hypothetical protein